MGMMDRFKGQMAKQAMKMLASDNPAVWDMIIAQYGDKLAEGLAPLKKAFEAKGLGALYDSWAKGGPKIPFTEEHLNLFLNDAEMQSFMGKMGVDLDDFKETLLHILPTLVEKVSKKIH